MLRQESNRAKVARIEREKKRGRKSDATQAAQAVQPEVAKDAEDGLMNDAGVQDFGVESHDISNGGQAIENEGQSTVANETTVFKLEPFKEMLQVRI